MRGGGDAEHPHLGLAERLLQPIVDRRGDRRPLVIGHGLGHGALKPPQPLEGRGSGGPGRRGSLAVGRAEERCGQGKRGDPFRTDRSRC